MHPTDKIWMFSRHEEDPAYDDLGVEIKWITVTSELVDTDIDLSKLRDSLVIFDDCDNLQDRKLSNFIHKLVNDIISNGRKFGIYCLYIGHQIMNYQKTRDILNEANKVIFYNVGPNSQVRKFLEKYGDLNKGQIEKIFSLPSRWIGISQTIPQYIIHEKGIFLL